MCKNDYYYADFLTANLDKALMWALSVLDEECIRGNIYLGADYDEVVYNFILDIK